MDRVQWTPRPQSGGSVPTRTNAAAPLKLQEEFVPAPKDGPVAYQKRLVAVVDRTAQPAERLPSDIKPGTVVVREVALKDGTVFQQDVRQPSTASNVPTRIMLSDESSDGTLVLADGQKEQHVSVTTAGQYTLHDLAGLAHLVDGPQRTPRFPLQSFRHDTYYVNGNAGGVSGYQWQRQEPDQRPRFSGAHVEPRYQQRPVVAWEGADGIDVPLFHQAPSVKSRYAFMAQTQTRHLAVFVTRQQLQTGTPG